MIYISVILHICAVLICISFLAYRFRAHLAETLPVFVCIIALTLYILAMVHRLSWIDGIEALAVVMFGIWLAGRSKEVRKEYFCI